MAEEVTTQLDLVKRTCEKLVQLLINSQWTKLALFKGRPQSGSTA